MIRTSLPLKVHLPQEWSKLDYCRPYDVGHISFGWRTLMDRFFMEDNYVHRQAALQGHSLKAQARVDLADLIGVKWDALRDEPGHITPNS
jgi:hypothetical protein